MSDVLGPYGFVSSHVSSLTSKVLNKLKGE